MTMMDVLGFRDINKPPGKIIGDKKNAQRQNGACLA